MATTFEMAKGAIMTAEGGDKLRGELLGAHTVRCGDLWLAQASVYSDGAAEIEVCAGYDAAGAAWRNHEFYYSFEAAIKAIGRLEATGELPAEEEL